MSKLHWLKRTKLVETPLIKNETWTRKEMIQNLIFEVYLLISDFLAECLKVNKNSQQRSLILKYRKQIYFYNIAQVSLTSHIFQETYFGLVSESKFTHSQSSHSPVLHFVNFFISLVLITKNKKLWEERKEHSYINGCFSVSRYIKGSRKIAF